jgi:hypothetical protein
MNLFHQQKTAFVSVRAEQFVIDPICYDALRVLIVKIQPIRKFFRDGKLQCYSMDGKISQSKKYCVFCDDVWRCQRKLRLSMLMLDAMDPLVLDINQPSFERLQTLVDQCKDQLDTTPVTLRIVYDEQDRRGIEFIAEH